MTVNENTGTTGKPTADLSVVGAASSRRLFVIANRNIYVDGLIKVIGELPGYKIVECAEPNDGCFTSFAANPGDILLVDQSVIDATLRSTGIDNLFSEFMDAYPELRIIVFGREFNDGFVRKMLRAGAHGFIDSNMTQDTLLKAIHEVDAGGFWISREALQQIIYSAVEMERIIEQNIRERVEAIQGDLTRREAEVLKCVLEGLSTREIAEQLNLSEQSVKLHLGRLFRKFEVNNRSQLILMAFTRVCPVSNLIKLFRSGLDKRRLANDEPPVICDPLSN